MRKVTLQQLRCHEQEDWFGADDIQLDIIIDGDKSFMLRRSMEKGDRWTMNHTYTFESSIEFRLIERDNEGNDFIGKHRLVVTNDRELPWVDRLSFRGDDAHYALQFVVEDAPGQSDRPGDRKQQALEMVAQFQSKSGSGVWRNISRQQLADGLRLRIEKPVEANQRGTPFCGPIAILYKLAERDPHVMAKMAIELWERGLTHGQDGEEIKPSSDTKNSRLPATFRIGGRFADWVLTASWRDAENLFFDVEGGQVNWAAGLTTQWEMAGWCKSILGFSNVEIHNTYVYGEADAARATHRAVRSGGVGFWMIDSSLIKNDIEVSVGFPTHWVAYERGLKIIDGVFSIWTPWIWDNGSYSFQVWSWGRVMNKITVTEGEFEERFFAAVSAT